MSDARDYFARELARLRLALRAVHRGATGHEPEAASVREVRDLRAARDRVVRSAGRVLPFDHAVRTFALGEFSREALTLAAAVEAAGDIAAAVRELGGGPWPTIALIAAVTALGGDDVSPLELVRHDAVADGLFDIVGEGPLPTRMVRISTDVAVVLAGLERPRITPEPTVSKPSTALIGPAPRITQLWRWADAVPAAPCLVLAGAARAGRRRWAAAACGRAGLPLVVVDLADDPLAEIRAARRWARWHRAALMLRFPSGWMSSLGGKYGSEAAARARQAVSACAEIRVPVLVAATAADADALARAGLDATRIDVGDLTAPLREALWRRVLPPGTAESREIRTVSYGFPFRAEQIDRAARRVSIAPDLAEACRDVGACAVGELATRLDRPFSRDDLIVPERVALELDLAIAWARRRATVLDEWGFGARAHWGRGVAALFAGKPGTGKTMAAQVLAAELGLDVYRVDLSRVVDRYVGETEKHLARLFDEVTAAGAVLFFDEADALFGRRSQVRDAHDRFANIEIGYLLQRLEVHDGITILATNRQGDLDEAFLRRFQVSIVFPMPDPADRLRLWRRAIPAHAPRSGELPLEELSRDYDLSGGDIQTAAMGAAFLAADAGVPISAYHLYRGVHRVLTKNGLIPDQRMLQIVRAGAAVLTPAASRAVEVP